MKRAVRERVVRLSRRRRRFNLRDQDARSWQDRAETAVELWTRNAGRLLGGDENAAVAVADLGCGNERLEDVLAERMDLPFTYQGYDLEPQSSSVIKLDVRTELPRGSFNLVFVLGLLEYLPDPVEFAARVRTITPYVIVSYVVSGDAAELSPGEREARGWVTHLTRDEVQRVFEQAGWVSAESLLTDGDRTGLWLFRSPGSSQAPAHEARRV